MVQLTALSKAFSGPWPLYHLEEVETNARDKASEPIVKEHLPQFLYRPVKGSYITRSMGESSQSLAIYDLYALLPIKPA